MINLGPYSGRNCPNVRFRPGLLDRMLEGAALFLFLLLCGSMYWLYIQKGGNLPHDVWVISIVALFCLLLLGGGSYLPVRFVNFPVRVNERNVGVQYLLAVRLVRVINVILNLTCVLQVLMEYYKWAKVLFGASFILLFIAFIVYFILAFKYK